MPTFRLALIAASAAAIALSGCTSGGGGNNQSANSANAAGRQEVPKLPIPTPEAPLSREQLLVAAMQAATDFAAGVDDGNRQKQLANKKFEFRIRFGCEGPSASALPALGWSLNEKSGTLKLRATPALSPKDEPVAHIAGEAFEAVEGFWVRRPWMLTAVCPRAVQPAAAEAEATAPEQPTTSVQDSRQPEQLVGIAQFFTATAPRTMRRSECAASRESRSFPSRSRSKGTPNSSRSWMRAGPSATIMRVIFSSTIPAPAATVSATCFSNVSPLLIAAAMPPCAQAEEAP